MAWRSYSVLDILLPTIIIIKQEFSQVLKICKCLWSLSCGVVSNMLLFLSIYFHCHHHIWGCMCSTGPFQFRWLKWYIHSSCCYYHQVVIININHCYYIFLWSCSLDVCYIIYCHYIYNPEKPGFCYHYYCAVYDDCSRIRNGLQIVFVCLYITPSQ